MSILSGLRMPHPSQHTHTHLRLPLPLESLTSCPTPPHPSNVAAQVPLKYFEEVFTSEHWMMRIYRVRESPTRDKPRDSGRAGARQPLEQRAESDL